MSNAANIVFRITATRIRSAHYRPGTGARIDVQQRTDHHVKPQVTSMATEAELEQLEEDLRKLVIEASKYEQFDTIEKMQEFVERTLTDAGYVCRNGVWQHANN